MLGNLSFYGGFLGLRFTTQQILGFFVVFRQASPELFLLLFVFHEVIIAFDVALVVVISSEVLAFSNIHRGLLSVAIFYLLQYLSFISLPEFAGSKSQITVFKLSPSHYVTFVRFDNGANFTAILFPKTEYFHGIIEHFHITRIEVILNLLCNDAAGPRHFLQNTHHRFSG